MVSLDVHVLHTWKFVLEDPGDGSIIFKNGVFSKFHLWQDILSDSFFHHFACLFGVHRVGGLGVEPVDGFVDLVDPVTSSLELFFLGECIGWLDGGLLRLWTWREGVWVWWLLMVPGVHFGAWLVLVWLGRRYGKM